MRSRDIKAALAFLVAWLLLNASSTWSAGAVLTGRVIDLGATGSDAGISGVRILVKNDKNQEIAPPGLTDLRGVYKIKLPASEPILRLYCEKLGYQRRPTIISVTAVANEQKPVLMMKESADTAYYSTVAVSMASQTSGLSVAERRERAAIVAALPHADKSRVLENLEKANSVVVLNDIRLAERTERILSDINMQFANHGLVGPWARPDYKSAGTIRLEGIVQSASARATAEKVARSVPGVREVRNELMIAQ